MKNNISCDNLKTTLAASILVLLPFSVQAVEVSMTGQVNRLLMNVDNGAASGLVLLDDPALAETLDRYSHFHAARAELLTELGDTDGAASAYERALQTGRNDRERAFLTRRRAALDRV